MRNVPANKLISKENRMQREQCRVSTKFLRANKKKHMNFKYLNINNIIRSQTYKVSDSAPQKLVEYQIILKRHNACLMQLQILKYFKHLISLSGDFELIREFFTNFAHL